MRVTKYFIVVFFSFFVTILPASDKVAIAVLEFQNRSKGAVRYNGTDMAAWMSNDLKRLDRFEPYDRKAVAKIVKGAKWLEDRLSPEDEAKLLVLPAKYALYGSIVDWRSSIDSSSTGTGISPRMRTKEVIPGVVVILHFELVDLSTGKSVKSFESEGSGEVTTRSSGPPEGWAQIEQELADFDRTFEEACKASIRKAANRLSNDE